MPRSLPSPVAAAIGLVPATLDGVRRLPVKAVQLPVLALSGALNTVDLLRREYAELAERGEQLVARLRGEVVQRADEIEDRVGDLVDRPLAEAEDELQQALGQVSSFAPGRDEVKAALAPAAGFAPAPTAGPATPVDPEAATPAAPSADPAPTSAAGTGRVDTAASPESVAAVERAVEQVRAAAPDAEELTRDELPLADYDHMTLGSLRGRMRSLSVEQLVEVRAYEKAHADRLPIVTMLDNRIAKLSVTTGGAAPTPVGPA